jgi:hypothetical protein
MGGRLQSPAAHDFQRFSQLKAQQGGWEWNVDRFFVVFGLNVQPGLGSSRVFDSSSSSSSSAFDTILIIVVKQSW